MKLKKPLSLVRALCLATAVCGTTGVAVAASTNDAAVTAPAAKQTLTLLGGPLTFTLDGYVASAVPGGAPGTMYYSKAEKRVMIVGEDDIPLVGRGGTDDDVLDGLKGIKDQQKKASPDYKVISENTENVNGLKVHHIEATDNMDGNDVQQATLLATANNKIVVIQVISGSRDKAGHLAAVNNILRK